MYLLLTPNFSVRYAKESSEFVILLLISSMIAESSFDISLEFSLKILYSSHAVLKTSS